MRILAAGVLAASMLAFATPRDALAQAYPERPISMIVPFAAGGATDVLARLIGQAMAEDLGRPVLVENVTGAGGSVGMQRALTAEPDGYTLIFSHMANFSALDVLYPGAGVDPATDLEPIGLVATVPMLLSVSNASGVEDLAAFRETLAGGEVLFGHAGTGSVNHIASVAFLLAVGADAVEVPYQGGGPANTDLMAGQIDAVIDQTASSMPLALAGSVRSIAVTSPERIEAIPDVPTFAEAGLPEFDMNVWNALGVPAGTPDEIRDRLEAALDVALDSDAVRARFAELAIIRPEGEARGANALRTLMAADAERLGRIIEGGDIRVQ